MINLPSPKHFKEFTLEFMRDNITATTHTEYDLNSYNQALKQAIALLNKRFVVAKFYELFDPRLLTCKIEKAKKVLHRFIGYSKKHDTLCITLFDKEEQVQTLALREAKDRDGNRVKWKTYGSKNFIPYNIKENSSLIFTASGMAEIILFELLELDYFLLQSDSIVKSLAANQFWSQIKEKMNNNLVIFLLDNDTSSHNAYKQFQQLCPNSISLDFEIILEQKLPKGYDFRDFCNQIAEKEDTRDIHFEIKQRLYATIDQQLERHSHAAS